MLEFRNDEKLRGWGLPPSAPGAVGHGIEPNIPPPI
jgi:hypothetical protein